MKARKVLGVKAQNANPKPLGGLAWRIRIGNGQFGGNTKTQPVRISYLREFFRTGVWWGRNPVYLCPPIDARGQLTTAL